MNILLELEQALNNSDFKRVSEIQKEISFNNLIVKKLGYDRVNKTFTVYLNDDRIRLYHQNTDLTFYIYDLIKDKVITEVKRINDVITYRVND